ncbi:MAG: hypothetical protein HFI49_03645 [Bacilli bacterium]|nr:hypothetical protein [Bacilli bacterium]
MEILLGKKSRIYNYMENVFKTVSSYYNYEFIKFLGFDTESDVKSEITNYYLENSNNSFKKYCYLDTEISSKESCFSFLILNNDTIYQDAEIISMNYRILEELKLEDIIVRINTGANYDLKKLQEYLEQLDIDYEINNGKKELETDVLMTFEIVMEIKDKTVTLATGIKKSDNIKTILCRNYLDSILSVLSVIYEDYNFDALTQVLIAAEVEEERIMGMKLAQDLRWCEIKVDIDTSNKPKKEQMDNSDCNFIIDVDKNSLSKGLIKVIDNLTKEETLVDENEIIDYIVSNI